MKRKGFAKTAPKSLEKRIIDNALLIKNDFSIILPGPLDDASRKVVKSLEKKLKKVWMVKDDAQRLEKLSRKKGVEGALAAILILANDKKAPYLAQVRIGGKNISYAVRGKAEREKLISLQHFDDPVLRLLFYRDIAFKKKLAFYSWNNKLVCSSASSDIPEEFLEFLSKHLGLQREKNVLRCSHLVDEDKERMFIEIKNIRVEICRDCLSDKNTFMEISKYFIDPNLKKKIKVGIVSPLLEYNLDTNFTQEYLEGRISDFGFFEKNLKKWKNDLTSREVFLIYWKGKVFKDTDVFLEQVGGDEIEKKGLKILFSLLNEPVFLDDASPNAILKIYWKKFGEKILVELSGDGKLSAAVFNPGEPPIKQLREIAEIMEKSNKISRYPVVENVSPIARFVDDIVKEYILHGKDRILTKLSKVPQNTRERSIAYAFLLALGKGEERKWQYRKEEIEFGEFLKEYAGKLLEAKPENYLKRLKELLAAAGAEYENR